MKGLASGERTTTTSSSSPHHLLFFVVVVALLLVASLPSSSGGYTAYRRNSGVGDETSSGSSGAYSESTNQVADSISVEESPEKIKLRMPNGQILIGNRKTVIFKAKAIRTKKIIYEFLGLPFAEPPLGDKRFMFPVRLSTLLPTDTYDATYHRPSCMQAIDETFPKFYGAEMWNAPGEISEDCLYFNLWVPVSQEQDNLLFKHETMNSIHNVANLKYQANGFKDRTSTLKTSLIWFYGGSFSSGSASLAIYNGTVLAAFENIIVMTPNYRVGPFGFLYLNSSEAPGNAAIADQIMAIEWYKNNYLDFFGGLTSSICLFGESAGAMSLHHLMLTEKRDLFNRVILQSSSSYSDLTYRSPSETYQVWLTFAEKVGCLKIEYEYEDVNVTVPLKLKMRRKKIDWNADRNKLNQVIVKCLIETDAQTILNKQFEIEFVNEYLKMQSIPTLDYHGLIAIDPIEYSFAKNKHNIYFNHDVLSGVNQNEGTYFMMYYLYYHQTRMADLNGFVNVDKFDYNNEFVIERLKELFKTLHPSVEYEQIMSMDLGDWQGSSSSSSSRRPPKIQILSDDKYNKNITDAINDYFLDKYARCLSDLYTYNKDPAVLDYDLDKKRRGERTPERAFKKMSKIAGDYTFNCPTIHFANEYSQVHHGRSYVYKFNHRSRAVPWPKWLGVSHGFEIEFVFGVPWTNNDVYDADDRLISRKMMNVWANFAKHGKLYCHFDPISSRQYFIEFVVRPNSSGSGGGHYQQPSEDDEFNLFNRYYPNCDLLNELNNKPDYSSKYDECMRYKLKTSVPLNGQTSTTSRQTCLSLIIVVTLFFFSPSLFSLFSPV